MKEFIENALKKYDINLVDSVLLDNTIFIREDKMFEISNWCLYGISRLCFITDLGDDRQKFVKFTPVTDQDWFNNYIKPIILKQLL